MTMNSIYLESIRTLACAAVFALAACTPQNGDGGAPADEVFDRSGEFEKQYDVVDVLEFTEDNRESEELADLLQTVMVTPDGKVTTVPLSRSDLRLFLSVIGVETEEEGVSGEFDEFNLGDQRPQGEAELTEQADLELQPDEAIPESVIGTDTRTRITATTRYPFRTMGRIDIGCTGTLIGPRHVLTAGHCVYNTRTDRWYSNLDFSPGQNGNSRPYGKIDWARAITVKGWTRGHLRNYDYAMIVLRENIGNRVGWMGYGWRNPMPKYNVNINGYPGDKAFGTLWHAYCRLQIIRKYRLYYPCDTAGGMSGSGVYVYWQSLNRRIIYGIHAYGVDGTGLNGATRIRKPVFENLKKWKSTY